MGSLKRAFSGWLVGSSPSAGSKTALATPGPDCSQLWAGRLFRVNFQLG